MNIARILSWKDKSVSRPCWHLMHPEKIHIRNMMPVANSLISREMPILSQLLAQILIVSTMVVLIPHTMGMDVNQFILQHATPALSCYQQFPKQPYYAYSLQHYPSEYHGSYSSYNTLQQYPSYNTFQQYPSYDTFQQYPSEYLQSGYDRPYLGQLSEGYAYNLEDTSHRVGGSVMVYRLTFRPPFTWTYNCFCDCEENTLYVPRVPGQQMNFTQADKYCKGQIREAASEAFKSIGVVPQGLVVTTSFWPYPAFIVNDINIAKANYIKGKYFYTLSNNTLELRCHALDASTCLNKANYKTFQDTATLTVDILNVISPAQRQQLAIAIQRALEFAHVIFVAPVQLVEDNLFGQQPWKNLIPLDP